MKVCYFYAVRFVEELSEGKKKNNEEEKTKCEGRKREYVHPLGVEMSGCMGGGGSARELG